MNFSLFYLFNRLVYRILDFLHHWYYDASRQWAHFFISALEKLDRTFAFGITFKYFFHPLYKDYTILGRILGVIFRTGRIILGGVLYLGLAVVFLGLYLAWILVPAAVILTAFIKFFQVQ